MATLKIFLLSGFLLLWPIKDITAQQPMKATQALDARQQSIVSISAFTANGELTQLQNALHNGLSAGLTVNEIKEVVVQLYAYCGFPRSLNALNTFMAVVKERKDKGVADPVGKEPDGFRPTTTLQFGTEIQTWLTGSPVKAAVYEFAPVIDTFLKTHLFADIFGRNNLDWKTRELATISALAALGGAGAQLRSHFGVGLYNGLSEAELHQLVSFIQTNVGAKEGAAASAVWQEVLKQRQPAPAVNEKAAAKKEPILPRKAELFIRIAEIEIHTKDLEAYKAILKEEAAASQRLEPGVISIFPMYKKNSPAQVRLLEIYAGKEAYEAHLKTPHFQHYKTSTLAMVKSLQLVEMEAMDPATMTAIFSKLKE